MIFYYQYKNKNSAISHNIKVEADNQEQAQEKIIKKLGTNFEIYFLGEDPLAHINNKHILNHDEVI